MATVEDIAADLLRRIRESFRSFVSNNTEIQMIVEDIKAGTATYRDAEIFAWEAGSELAKAFRLYVSPDILPDGRMSREIAESVLRPMLEEDYALVADTVSRIQATLNRNAGIGLKAQVAELNESRVRGIIGKVSGAEQFEDVSWVLDAPIRNFSMNVVDTCLQRNAEFQYLAGMRPRIIRRAEPRCCPWCAMLEGEYEYPDVPHDVYRRHNNCRCLVEYDPGDGRRQNVHTKKWTTLQEDATIEARKRKANVTYNHRKKFPINQDTGEQYTRHPVRFSDAQFGKKVGKHASDFGLNPNSMEDRGKMRAIIERIVDNAEERFYGEWWGQEYPVLFHIVGEDVVIENKYGEFVTVLKGGVSSARVKKARGE